MVFIEKQKTTTIQVHMISHISPPEIQYTLLGYALCIERLNIRINKQSCHFKVILITIITHSQI